MNDRLLQAIETYDIDAVELLLEQGADPAGDYYLDIYEALIDCADRDIVDLVIDHVNTPNEYGLSPLHIATISGDAERVETLIKLGANPLTQDNNGKLASDYLTKGSKNKASIKDILLEAELKEDLLEAIHDSAVDEVKDLLNRYQGIDYPADIFGRTLLTAAINARHFNLEIFQYLLDQGALVTTTLLDQIEELDQATHHKVMAQIKFHINDKNKHGLTPLHRAVICDSTDSVSAYIELGADSTLKDGNGNTPFHYARGNVAQVFTSNHRSEADDLLDELSLDSSDELRSTPTSSPNNSTDEDYHQLLKDISDDIKRRESGTVEELQQALIDGSEKALKAAESLAKAPVQNDNTKIVITALVGVAFSLLGAALLFSPLAPFAAAALVTHGLLTASAAVTAVSAAAYTSMAVGCVLEIAAASRFFSQPNDNQSAEPIESKDNAAQLQNV